MYYLAEIDPGPTAPHYGRQWSLFDADAKFSYDELTQRETLVATFSETPRPALGRTHQYHAAYAALKAASNYGHADWRPGRRSRGIGAAAAAARLFGLIFVRAADRVSYSV